MWRRGLYISFVLCDFAFLCTHKLHATPVFRQSHMRCMREFEGGLPHRTVVHQQIRNVNLGDALVQHIYILAGPLSLIRCPILEWLKQPPPWEGSTVAFASGIANLCSTSRLTQCETCALLAGGRSYKCNVCDRTSARVAPHVRMHVGCSTVCSEL